MFFLNFLKKKKFFLTIGALIAFLHCQVRFCIKGYQSTNMFFFFSDKEKWGRGQNERSVITASVLSDITTDNEESFQEYDY